MAVPAPHRQPRYRAIADELRRRITAGAIPAGDLMPSENALTAEFRVARGTIRQAINVLRTEGLVVTEHGRGTYARSVLSVRKIGADRYQLGPSYDSGSNAWHSADLAVETVDQVDGKYREVPATAQLAEMFEVQHGTMLLKRRLLESRRGVPQQLTTSYFLYRMVTGTPVADPSREPWPGGHVAQLRSLGIAVTGIREVVSARMPTVEEVSILRISAGAPLLHLTRRTISGVRIVEVAIAVLIPSDHTHLQYEITL